MMALARVTPTQRITPTQRTSLLSIGMLCRIVRRVVLVGVGGVASLLALYFLVSSPPLHLAYNSAPDAGANSVYVPGKNGGASND
jgi:hypothetical protein